MNNSKIYAAIDIGSNSVKLLLSETIDGKITSRTEYIRTTRLGEVDDDTNIKPEAIALTASVISEFDQMAKDNEAKVERILATSAVRDAANKDELLAAIRRVIPQPVEIISGEAEAGLSYKGAKSLTSIPLATPVLDVGGASTELIYELTDGKIEGISVNVGAVRMKNNGWDQRRIRQLLSKQLSARSDCDYAVGIGGTITAVAGVIAGLEKFDHKAIEGMVLFQEDLDKLLQELLPLSIEQRCAYSPLLSKRGEIIEQGLEIWIVLMEILSLKKIIVCSGGILDGAIADMI